MGHAADLSPVSRETLVDQIVDQLVTFLASSGLRPGDRLPPERELRQRLGVGRSSMREAIKALSTIGAIEVLTGQGMFVGQGSVPVLPIPQARSLVLGDPAQSGLIEARQVLEVEMAGLAALRATDEELREIEQWLDAMRVEPADTERRSLDNLEFHLAVARASRNGILERMLGSLRHVITVWACETYSDLAYQEHEPIYRAILARDRDGARRAMAEHLGMAGDRLFSHIAEAGPPIDLPVAGLGRASSPASSGYAAEQGADTKP